MMDIVNTLKSAIISGICIGVAGIGFLATRDIIGSVLFAFALLTVVAYKLKLYTGTAGFIKKGELPFLLLVFAGNVTGCLLMSLLARLSPMPLQESAQGILEGRLRRCQIAYRQEGREARWVHRNGRWSCLLRYSRKVGWSL